MSELNREQFNLAVADAVRGILNVYIEVDAMLRELGVALSDEEPRFRTLVQRLIPGAGRKNPDVRYLRNYHAAIFVPEDLSDDDDGDDDDDEGDDEEADEGAPAKKVVTIRAGSGLLVARATIYQPGTAGFQPNLVVGALTNCQVDVPVATGTELKLSRSRLKKLLRKFDERLRPGPLKTAVTTHVIDKPKEKRTLVFAVPESPQFVPMFDVTPERLREIASRARKSFGLSAQ